MPDPTIKSYNKQASYYEARWKSYLAHTHKAFLRRIKTHADNTILDASGGTGLLAEMMINDNYTFQQLIINDPSAGMLDIAGKRLSGEPSIKFTNYRAENLPFEANRFDRIFCLNSFHFYTRQQHVLNRCHTMLKPRGKLYLLDWNRTGFFHITNTLLKLLASEHIDTRSLVEFKEMLVESGFEVHRTDHWNWRYWKFFFVEAVKLP